MPEYLHQDPGTEIRFIAGHYTIVEEGRIDYCDRQVIYVVGIAAVSSSCCGTQGCRFINVPGYCVAWKYRRSESGTPVTLVEPVGSETEQREIREILQRQYPYAQVLFPA